MESLGPPRGSKRSTRSLNVQARGFDITGHMRVLCTDIVRRLRPLGHIDPQRVAFSFSQARKRNRHGLWASLTPMRFEDGALVDVHRGCRYTCQRLYDANGHEMLYIFNVYLPRFLNLSFHEKLVTVFHELWHISPAFDGDLRRHCGRCYAHTHSQEAYDAAMEQMAVRWLSFSPPEKVYGFLRIPFVELVQRFGGVYGTRVRHPKLLRVD